MIKAVFFDLDGTLVDTLCDLADSTNYALSKMGFPTHATEKFRYFVGDGVSKLIERALPEDKRSSDIHKECLSIYKNYYKEHYLDKSCVYDGVSDLIEKLKEKGLRLAILSNKHHEMTVTVAQTLFAQDTFDVVYGQKENCPAKPDPQLMLQIMNELGVEPSEAVMIGDSGMDMAVAANAKCKGIGVLWGFRAEDELRENGADYIVAEPSEILKILEEIK